MAWETRRRGGHYYTRSRKSDGRVVREYYGRGPAAELMAEADAIGRDYRQAVARAWHRERERLAVIDRELADLCRRTDDLLRAELTAAGYHQHARGEWRRKRGNQYQQEHQTDSGAGRSGALAGYDTCPAERGGTRRAKRQR